MTYLTKESWFSWSPLRNARVPWCSRIETTFRKRSRTWGKNGRLGLRPWKRQRTLPCRRYSRTDVKRFVIQMEAKRSARDIFPDIGSSHLVHGYFCHDASMHRTNQSSNRSEVSSDRTPMRCTRSIDVILSAIERNRLGRNVLSFRFPALLLGHPEKIWSPLLDRG